MFIINLFKIALNYHQSIDIPNKSDNFFFIKFYLKDLQSLCQSLPITFHLKPTR